MSDEEQRPLWKFSPLEAYCAPPKPATDKVLGGLRQLLRRIRPRSTDELTPPVPAQVPRFLLDRAAPAPGRDGAVEALDAALEERLAARRVQAVVGAPVGYCDDILGDWAAKKGWRLVKPPGLQAVLHGHTEQLEAVFEDEASPVAVPGLDRWYARHEEGLGCLRQLLQRLAARPGPCVLGFGPWSWSYLNRALRIDGLVGSALALEPFDEKRLQSWLLDLAGGSDGRFSFREIGSGKPVFPESATGTSSASEPSDFLERLAGYSRGIPLVAWAVWRHALRLPDRDAPSPTAEDESDTRYRFVVPGWSKLELPTISGDVESADLLVLHVTLLHGSVAHEQFVELLPLTSTAIQRGVRRLEQAGVLEPVEDRWRVSALGYAAAHDALRGAGVLAALF